MRAMEPARSIIAKFAHDLPSGERISGEKVVSQITGTAYTAPYRWQHAKLKGGTGGLIPQRYHRMLIDAARQRGVLLSAEEFLPLELAEAS